MQVLPYHSKQSIFTILLLLRGIVEEACMANWQCLQGTKFSGVCPQHTLFICSLAQAVVPFWWLLLLCQLFTHSSLSCFSAFRYSSFVPFPLNPPNAPRLPLLPFQFHGRVEYLEAWTKFIVKMSCGFLLWCLCSNPHNIKH